MYRDDEGVRERFEAVVARAKQQLEGVTEDDLQELPDLLRKKLADFEPDFEPDVVSPAALQNAERALEEREPLAREARAYLRKLHRAERRLRRDRALEWGLWRQRLRRTGLSLVVLVAIAVPAYLFVRKWANTGCRKSATCRMRGDCTANYTLSCYPGSDADCEQSVDCREHGWCSNFHGMCEARDAKDCAHLGRCQPPATCAAVDGFCESR